MRSVRADAWDEGNYLTRFYEILCICDWCDGEGKLVDEESDTGFRTCPECEGSGTQIKYK